jgi:hypothetical protein
VLIRFFFGTITTLIILSTVYNGTKSSIPIVFIYHWLLNLPYSWEAQAGISWMQDLVSFAAMIVLVLIFGQSFHLRDNLPPSCKRETHPDRRGSQGNSGMLSDFSGGAPSAASGVLSVLDLTWPGT